MGKYWGTYSNGAIIADRYGFRMQLVYIDILADPNILSNLHTASTVKPRSEIISARQKERQFMKNSISKIDKKIFNRASISHFLLFPER